MTKKSSHPEAKCQRPRIHKYSIQLVGCVRNIVICYFAKHLARNTRSSLLQLSLDVILDYVGQAEVDSGLFI